MKISVIILNWNGKEVLEKAIKSILNQTYKNFEVIVVDNGSTDGSIEMIERYSNVKLIKLPYNYGIVEPRNIGMKNANGDLLFVIDNDVEVKEDAFENAVSKFNNKKLGIVSCSLIDKNGKTSVWMHKFPKEKYDKKSFLTTIYSGGAHVIRKSILSKTGYYPGYFFITAEEMDLSWRTIDIGYEIRYFPDIVVYHRQRSKNDVSDNSKFLAMRNVYWVYWRLLPLESSILRTAKKFVRELSIDKSVRPILEAFSGIYTVLNNRKPIKRSTVNLIKKLEAKIVT